MAGATGGAIRAGRAFVELATNDSLLIKGLQSAEKRVKAFGESTAKIGLKMAAAGSALLAPIEAVFDMSINRASDIKDLSDQLGIGTEKLSAMAYAFDQGGVGLKEFGDEMNLFRAKMFAAMDGGDELVDRLRLNFVSLRDVPIEDQFDTVLNAVNNLASASDRAQLGEHFFGRSWMKAQNTALKSLDAWRDAQQAAKKGGGIVSEEDARRGKEISVAMNAAWMELKNTVIELGAEVLGQSGSIKEIVGHIRQATQAARAWIRENRGWMLIGEAVTVGVIGLGVALVVLGKAVTVLGAGFGVAAAAAKVLGIGIGFLLSPIGLVAAAVVGLGVAWLTLTESGRKFAAELGAAFTGLGDIFSETWGGISAAISSGDLALAAEIAGAGLKAAWAETCLALERTWVKFKESVLDGWRDITDKTAEGIVAWQSGFIWLTENEDAARKHFQANVDQIGQMRREQDAANQKSRQADIDAAKADLAAARAKLTALANRAKAVAHGQGHVPGDESPEFDREGKRRNAGAAPPQLYAASKGTFGSYSGAGIGKSLGYGDNIAQRQLTTQQQILAANKQQAAAIAGIAAVAWK